MFSFDQNLIQTQAVATNTNAAIGNVMQASGDIRSTLDKSFEERNAEKAARAKVIAESLKFSRDKELKLYESDLSIREKLKQANIDSKLAIQKFGFDSKVAEATHKNKLIQDEKKAVLDTEFEKLKSYNKSFDDMLKNDHEIKKANDKAAVDIEIQKLKNIGTDVKKVDFNRLSNKVEADGGLENMITNTIKSIEDDQLFFDFELDDLSRQDLKASLINVFTTDSREVLKYELDRKDYIKKFMQEYGVVDNAYMPWSKDKWVPNDNAMLIKQKLKDIERLEGE